MTSRFSYIMTLCSSYLNLFSLYLANFEYISSQSYFFLPRTDFWNTAVQMMPALTWKEKTRWKTLQTLWEDLNFCRLHHPVNSDQNYNGRYFSNITRGGCPLHRLSQAFSTGFSEENAEGMLLSVLERTIRAGFHGSSSLQQVKITEHIPVYLQFRSQRLEEGKR